MTADQFKSTVQGAHQYDLGIIAAGVLAFLLSFFPYYTASFGGFSDSESAWHGFFGWFAALVALAVAVGLALRLFGISVLDPAMSRLVSLGGFALALVCTILAFFVTPGIGGCGSFCDGIDFGRGFGFWASAIAIIGGTVLTFLRKDATD